ncbi:serine-threonine protein kinase [Streptomyces griseus]|uniref:serine-threonine protein kinase n=1 Tax=Streptomyces griseus TaxID=1911 RepID=UPI0018FE1499|nr:serine-threonine protein kinase [Streptomyces griseus]
MSVEPYREIVLDKDGDGPAGQAAELVALARRGVTDLVVFAHGWNNSPSGATLLCSDFFAPFPELLAPGVEAGYAGVVWPSMMFTDEPVPDFRALVTTFPERERTLVRLTELLALAPPEESAFAEFGGLLRELAGADAEGFAAAGPVPDFLVADPVETCALFAGALEEVPGAVPDGGAGRLWKGGREALRQTAYYVMKHRAGRVGERGLGPLLAEVARAAPGLRVHLVGHSMGARLVAYALRGLSGALRPVRSMTLLQGAFSHYAFAARLPHDPGRSGALRDMQLRVRGPVVACHSEHDAALGVLYPLASRAARDPASLTGPPGRLAARDPRWGAIGWDGVQGVPGSARRTLAAALRDGVPASGCVSVDASEAVRSHSDVRRPELARVVVSAARIGRR